jgi:hypothetical protein
MPPSFWAAFLMLKRKALLMSRSKLSLLGFISLVVGACASTAPQLPYPAFVQTDELEDIFMASLPGVRAKQLAGDPQTRRSSNRIDIPRDWQGTSGGVPGRSMEIFVIRGEMTIADISLGSGGYAYLPAGSLGFNLVSDNGAQILYFVNDTDPDAMIQSPIIIEGGLLEWVDTAKVGVSSKELRSDPGNGSKTWLVSVATGAALAWESSTALREGYLITGNQQYSECVNGEVDTWQYSPGGYFYRPANTISGGPESVALTQSIWFFRETSKGDVKSWPECVLPPQEVQAPEVQVAPDASAY